MSSLMYRTDIEAVLPAAAAAQADLRSRGLAHRFVRHIRSSQAFALNLFAPLDTAGVASVFAELGYAMGTVEAPVFEWEDHTDTLAEASPRSRHRTQVDVVLTGTTTTGTRVAALVEVKLSEIDFGTCTAYDSPHNPDTDNCATPGLFGADPGRCFQLNNHGYGHRNYDHHLTDVPLTAPVGPDDHGGCYVRTGRNQPMRNLALAHTHLANGDVDEVVYALTAPSGHHTTWRRYAEFQAVLGDTDRVRTARLPAETVARAHPDRGVALYGRYAGALEGRPGGTALLHLSTDGGTLLGVWAQEAGVLVSYYGAGHDIGAPDRGEAVIGDRLWPDLLDDLPRRTPYLAWWETAPHTASETVRDIYDRLSLTHPGSPVLPPDN